MQNDLLYFLIMYLFLEVVEHSCAAGSLLQGESLQNISKDMDIVSYKLPLGVTAGICPFNFPAMIPLWMFPLALIAGNTMIIKPSERDPGATIMLMELLNEIGCPPGVVNVSKKILTNSTAFQFVLVIFRLFMVHTTL